jgi:release factor glutamine methyltransferase
VPLEYILENAEFYSLDFFVDNRVLVPRNDTEIMVDKAIEKIVELDNSTLIDI